MQAHLCRSSRLRSECSPRCRGSGRSPASSRRRARSRGPSPYTDPDLQHSDTTRQHAAEVKRLNRNKRISRTSQDLSDSGDGLMKGRGVSFFCRTFYTFVPSDPNSMNGRLQGLEVLTLHELQLPQIKLLRLGSKAFEWKRLMSNPEEKLLSEL